MMNLQRIFVATAALTVMVGGCTMTDNSSLQSVSDMSPQRISAEGQFIGFDQNVRAGRLIVTPTTLVDDDRCVYATECPIKGTVEIIVRVQSPTITEDRHIEVGEEIRVGGFPLTFTDVRPIRYADGPVERKDYRFRFTGS